MNFLEESTCTDYLVLFYSGRFMLYDATLGRPLVDESFTEKKVLAYLLELHECEEDDDDGYTVSIAIDEAKERGHTGDYRSLRECIETNKLGVDLIPISYETFLVTYFQRGIKNLYRCEVCNEVIRINDDESEFAGNGGNLMVSHFCKHCSSIARVYKGV
jgi:hypothetical protein